MSGRKITLRVHRALAMADTVLEQEAPCDLPVLLALLKLSLDAQALREVEMWMPPPDGKLPQLEASLMNVTRVLKERLKEVHNA